MLLQLAVLLVLAIASEASPAAQNDATSSTAKASQAAKCADVPTSTNEQYVHIHDVEGRELLCDTYTDGGKWTVVQLRTDGSQDFYLPWVDYERGFGNKTGEFWLGLSIMHHTMRTDRYEMRIDFNTSIGQRLYAQYNNFTLANAVDNYRIHISGYKGTAGDYFLYGRQYYNLDGMAFSTYDRDNDKSAVNCVKDLYHGAWWHNSCTSINPNGDWKGYSPAQASWGFSTRFTYFDIKIRPWFPQ
ncbi:fibrinogen-like protein A [Aplysia californica]|uniref:Fibrinogen-like protein A n=1 Tax=Aplysia californica TaxID=6500 RepID=A0ABM0JSQ9_APLCA|nr:fibrinogen-like protein A [Aplysia californica]